jgi:hypothetical protein
MEIVPSSIGSGATAIDLTAPVPPIGVYGSKCINLMNITIEPGKGHTEG